MALTGALPTSLHNWLTRDLGRGGLDLGPRHQKEGTGSRRLYSDFDLVKIEVAQQLLPLGVGPGTVNELIGSGRFAEWVRLALTPTSSGPLYRLIAITYTKDGMTADYLATADMTRFWERGFEDLYETQKAHIVLRLGDVVDKVRADVRRLGIARKPETELTDKEKAILAMQHQMRAAGENGGAGLRRPSDKAAKKRSGTPTPGEGKE